MFQHRYVVNALVEFPHRGVTARATRYGQIDAALPASEKDLRGLIVNQVADKQGCHPDQVTVINFTFTELPAA